MTEREELEALRSELKPKTERQELESLRKEFAGDQGNAPVDFSFSEMSSNIPSSALQFGKDIIQPFIHPIDTASGVADLAGGLMQKGQRAVSELVPEALNRAGVEFGSWLSDQGVPLDKRSITAEGGLAKTEAGEQTADAMGQFIADRYGSVDKAKQTFMKDPVGAMADLSTVFTGGGTLAAKMGGKTGKIGKVAQAIGKDIEPINQLVSTIKTPAAAIAKALPKSLPAKLYESSAKFSTTLSPKQRAAMTETALKHGILPTSSGVEKMQALMGGLSDKIDTLISTATESGKRIPRRAVYRHLKELRKDAGGFKIEGKKDLSQINKVAKDLDEMVKSGPEMITPEALQAFKRDAYSRTNYAEVYGKAKPGREQARKAMARAAKESIEEVIPEIGDVNRQYGELADLSPNLQRAAGRIDNRNLIGIDAPIKIMAGAGVGGPVGATAGTLAAILGNPKIKARLAMTIRDLQMRKLADILASGTGKTAVQQGLFQSGRLNEINPR